jgi:hypothetical protein
VLIHHPADDACNLEIWKGLVQAQRLGLTKVHRRACEGAIPLSTSPGPRARKLYRLRPNCETWPNILTENPY